MLGKKTAKMSQFHILGALVPIPLYNASQILQETADPWSTLTCQISFESVYCVTLQERKTAIWDKF